MSGHRHFGPRFGSEPGPVCVVTGATSGLGYEIALGLARLGARVVVVGRTTSRCETVVAGIRSETANDDVSFETAELSQSAQICSLATRIASRHARIGVLVNNAGTFSLRRIITSDGVELQFAVNYLAGFHLLARLFTQLADGARVINISSGSHVSARMHWNNLSLRPLYNGLAAYGQSKLAEVIFSYELARRSVGRNAISVYAVDPGLVSTEIGLKGTGPLVRTIWRLRTRRALTPAAAAEPIVRLAVDEAYAGKSGLYWYAGHPAPSSKRSCAPEAGPRLWELSEQLCGTSFPGSLS